MVLENSEIQNVYTPRLCKLLRVNFLWLLPLRYLKSFLAMPMSSEYLYLGGGHACSHPPSLAYFLAPLLINIDTLGTLIKSFDCLLPHSKKSVANFSVIIYIAQHGYSLHLFYSMASMDH